MTKSRESGGNQCRALAGNDEIRVGVGEDADSPRLLPGRPAAREIDKMRAG